MNNPSVDQIPPARYPLNGTSQTTPILFRWYDPANNDFGKYEETDVDTISPSGFGGEIVTCYIRMYV